MAAINYNQFGQLHESTIVTCPYSNEDITIDELWQFEVDSAYETQEADEYGCYDLDEARATIDETEAAYIAEMTDTIYALDVDHEVKDALVRNMRTKGTAYRAYLDSSDKSEKAELLERIGLAHYRHSETDYDDMRASGVDRDIARQII